MQMVVFSWLIAGELRESPERLGAAQLALVLPTVVLLLIGGALADRVDRRRLLARLHLAAAAVMGALGMAVAAGAHTYGLVVGYALLIGTLAAFSFPTRDSLLNEVAGANLMRVVVGTTLAQFVAQGSGQLAGGVARYVGPAQALALQSALMLVGALAALRLPAPLSAPNQARTVGGRAVRASELLEGVREVLGSAALRPVALLVVAVGLFFMGPYLVVYPLLVRDYYRGDAGHLSLLLLTFPLGSILSSLFLLRLGRVRRKGRALALAQGTGAMTLLAIGSGIPFAAAFAASVVWGLCGGVFINVGRTVFQETASPTHRARVLSIYTLGLMGAGAIGSPLSGVLAGLVGPRGAFVVCGGAMLLFVSGALAFSNIRRVE
jgi:MFS family permease